MTTEYVTSEELQLRERLAQLELAMMNSDWIPLGGLNSSEEFSRNGLRIIVENSRLSYLKNPLIRRGVEVQTFYVFGRGVSLGANDQAIKEVVDTFVNDEHNQTEITGAQARKERDKELRIDGNIFFALFVHPLTGRLRVGTIPFDEISEIIRDPQNRKRPQYYKRVWSYDQLNLASGQIETKTEERYYRDFRYKPAERPAQIGQISIDQECVIYHVKIGGFADWAFGVSQVYPAIDWARAYNGFLSDFAKIIKALARFAWRKKVSGGATGVAAMRAKLNTAIATTGIETNPSPTAGSVAIEGDNNSLDPIRTAGATTSATEGKPLKLMVASAFGLPDTFFGDTDTGNLATAKSLDRPTEMQFVDRQELWVGIYRTLLAYQLYHSVAAPNGALRGLGRVAVNEYGEEYIEWQESTDTTLQVDFPPILEQDPEASIRALISGATFDGKTPSVINDVRLLARQALIILGFDDVDSIIERMYPEDMEALEDPLLAQVNESLHALLEALRDD